MVLVYMECNFTGSHPGTQEISSSSEIKGSLILKNFHSRKVWPFYPEAKLVKQTSNIDLHVSLALGVKSISSRMKRASF